MTIGTNIPGQTSFFLNKQPRIGSGPTAPTPTIPSGHGGATSPYTPPWAQSTPQPQMQGYINTQAAKPPVPQMSIQRSAPTLNTYTPDPSPPASMYAGQDAAMAAGGVQAEKARYTQQQAGQGMSTAQAAVKPAAPTPQPASNYPQAGTPGSSLQDPRAITEAGTLYADRILKGLQGPDPLAVNAQQTEDTAASRRAYTARTSTEEQLGQSHFAPGSAQYQRAMDRSQAGVDDANLEGQNSVNDFTRKRTADNMAAAKDLEDTRFSHALGERTRTDLQGKDFANSLPDGKAKYAYHAMIAKGMSPQEAYNAVVGPTGTVNAQYQPSKPGATKVEGLQEEAGAFITATTGLKPGDPGYEKAVQKRLIDTDKTTQAPIVGGAENADLKTAQKTYTSGEAPLTGDQKTALIQSGDITEVSDASSPQIGSLAPGKGIKIGDDVYKVLDHQTARTGWTKSRDPRHTDYTTMKNTATGKTVYVYNGKINDQPPTAV